MAALKRVKPVVCALTGGPCGGKTSSLNLLRQFLKSEGFNCFTVPEVYTVLMNNGCGTVYPANFSDEVNQEKTIDCLSRELLFQISHEDHIISYSAVSDKPVVIICDRGALDIAAYSGDMLFKSILEKTTLNRESLLKRYDIVLHLVTAANGAEEFYSNITNEVRKETISEARTLDDITIHAWDGHHSRHIIPNGRGGIEEKMNLLQNIIFDYLKESVSETSEVDNNI